MTRKAGWRELALVLAVTLAYLVLVHFRGGLFIYTLSQQEGAVWIDEANRTLQGEVIYRDFFEFLTPGIVYVNAAFLGLLGDRTATLGAIVVVLGALATAAVHALSSVLLAHPWRHVPAPLFVLLPYGVYSPGNHKWPAIICCLAALLAVAGRRTVLRCALAGVALGAATLTTQDFGAGAALGMTAALWLLRDREPGVSPLAFVGAYVLAVGSVLLGFAAVAGFEKVWFSIVTVPLVLYPKIGHHFTIAVGGLRDLPISLTAFGLGGAGLVFTAAGVLRRFWRTDAVPLVIAALTGAGLLVVGGLAHPVEPMQISVRVIVLTIVAFCWIERAIAARGLARPARSVLAALGIVLATYAVARVVKRQAGGHLIREAHRAGTVWVARAMDDVTWLEANTAEGEPVFAFPDKGGLYFLSRTRNVTSYPVLLDQGFHTESQVTEAIRQIAASCATVGIWDRTRLASGVHHQDWFTLKPLYQAILRDYAIVAELPNGAYGLRRTTSCDLRDPRSD